MTEQGQAPTTEIPKAYDPSQIERTWYPVWEREGYFKPSGDGDETKDPGKKRRDKDKTKKPGRKPRGGDKKLDDLPPVF